MFDPHQDKPAECQDTKQVKKPYEKPEILYRAPLEALSAFCNPATGGKASGQPGCSAAFS